MSLNMKNNIIDSDTLEAARIYDAFITAIALPGLFKKDTVQLVINTLNRDLKRDYSDDSGDAAEKKIIQSYIKYLKGLV
jgi:hypothetical protein